MKKIIEKYWLIFAGVHFLISCIISRGFFTTEPLYGYMNPIDMAPQYTEEMLRTISFVLTKGIAALLIVGFWYLIVCLVQKRIRKELIVTFVILSAVLGIYIMRVYPGLYKIETDNYIIFQYAIRHLPYYWHGAITSAVYGAAYTILPHTAAVPLIQCNLFLGVVLWCYEKLRYITQNKWAKVMFILLLLPESYEVLMSPYRNSMYAALSVWGVAYVFFAIYEKKGKMTWYLPIMFAFIAAWRTEGIIIGAGLFFVLQILTYENVKRLVVTTAMFVLCFLCLNKIQGIGSEKYYGNDYLFVSTMNPLSVVISEVDANLSYEGAEEDLEALGAVTPVNWIQCGGIGGFRAYNDVMGREINQTCATKEQQSAFLLAYARIVLHNLDTFLSYQISNTLAANGTSYPFEFHSYVAEYVQIPYDFANKVFGTWDVGMYEFEARGGASVAASNPMEEEGRVFYEDIWEMTHLSVASRFVAVIYMIYMCISSVVAFIKTKNLQDILIGLVPLLLLGQLAVLVLTIPEGRPAYFYPLYVQLMFVLIAHCLVKSRKC